MNAAKILWVDDEMESLKSQIMFLENKGYEVKSLSNGFDAIDYVKENFVDVVLLDESMPGITGLETLQKIKELNSQTPIVLITKNETENLIDEAIGSQISDYLIKPVNPNQVWLSLKKIKISQFTNLILNSQKSRKNFFGKETVGKMNQQLTIFSKCWKGIYTKFNTALCFPDTVERRFAQLVKVTDYDRKRNG